MMTVHIVLTDSSKSQRIQFPKRDRYKSETIPVSAMSKEKGILSRPTEPNKTRVSPEM